jgi:hypothetical protein
MIGQTSYWRGVFAVMAWRTGGFKHVLLSGAGSALPIRDLMLSQGVPAEAIVIEDRSLDTREERPVQRAAGATVARSLRFAYQRFPHVARGKGFSQSGPGGYRRTARRGGQTRQ